MPWHALKSSGGGSAADGDDEDAVLTMSESVKPGQKVKVQEVSLGEHQTGPPDYLTESDIITLMEKHAIGRSIQGSSPFSQFFHIPTQIKVLFGGTFESVGCCSSILSYVL